MYARNDKCLSKIQNGHYKNVLKINSIAFLVKDINLSKIVVNQIVEDSL